MVRRLFLVAVLVAFVAAVRVHSQGELNCTVRINTPQLQQTDRRVFDQLEVSLRDFLNNTKWTNDAFEPDERIKCNFILTIRSELGNNTFEGELAVQSVRPVYGSTYESPMLSHLDRNIIFQYEQNQPIQFQPDVNDNPNLPSLFAFYAYIILGLDYDSFSLFGGDPHLLMAQQVVTNIQNTPGNSSPGWRPADGGGNRNRYWIIENLLNPRVRPMRAAMYTYHRKGLDLFGSDVNTAKNNILQALEEVDKVNTAYFNAMIVQMFANAKKDEIVEMWKIGDRQQKERVQQIMMRIDPLNMPRYREIGP
ncbi:MAG: DUF4835 family protein [Saprospiraceae bacterium]|nr:DUF4835 family protein [Saprospiraceae bacterium]MDW8230659.1 DUF4835 family protein [Saprospiraceae bacterium]